MTVHVEGENTMSLNVVLIAVLAVLVVGYVMRRRTRLNSADEF